ncbi:hypothetical protein OZZ08_13035 [Malaciobacter mytili]|uniref:hypothetical protein n=1 Tax=Malaciobacter mytili TaxID=603050 RepID=UPI003BB0C1CE
MEKQHDKLEFQIGITAQKEDSDNSTKENNSTENNSNTIIKNDSMDITDSSNSEKLFKIAISTPDVAVEMLTEHLEKNNHINLKNIPYVPKNLLLKISFLPISSLQRKNFYSFTKVNSYKILSSSLELEKNIKFNNRFYDEIKVA